jgi:hypothetical protein
MLGLGEDLADDVAEYASRVRNGGELPYESVRALRTKVGKKIDSSILQPDAPLADLKRLYGALSDDLLEGVKEYGSPQAVAAVKGADAMWKARMARIDKIDKVVQLNGGPEKVYAATMSGTRDGATRLKSVYEALDPATQDAVTGSFVRRLGEATPGAQNATGDQFSLNTYLTNWNKVSPEAKAIMFRNQPELREHTEAIARTADEFKKTMRLNQNTSNTARQLGGMGVGGATIMGVITGNFGAAASAAALPAATYGFARLMTSPKFVKWLADNGRMPIERMPQAINQLRAIGEKTGDDDIIMFTDTLEQQIGEQEQ